MLRICLVSVNMKKVTFSENITVHYIAFDREERKGPWMQVARDRARFHRRIKALEIILKPTLELLFFIQQFNSSCGSSSRGGG